MINFVRLAFTNIHSKCKFYKTSAVKNFSQMLIPQFFSYTTGISIPEFSRWREGERRKIRAFPPFPILSNSPGKCANSKSRCGCWRGFDEIRASISSTLFRFACRYLFCSGHLFFKIRSKGRFNFRTEKDRICDIYLR